MKTILSSFILVLAFILFASAQAPPNDEKFMQNAMRALQLQRNQALDAHAAAEAHLALLTEELKACKEASKDK